MKDQYTIHEIADLYGIGPDSLRYYERLGLIHPKRGRNGYRLYDLGDIYRLTIIRDLLELGFGTDRIRVYLEELNLQNTLTMLEEERRLIVKRQAQLRERQRSLEKRMETLHRYEQLPVGTVELVELPARPCVRLNTDIARDEEFDFAIRKLHHLHDDTIRDLGSQTMGASMAQVDLEEGRYGLFRSVFFVLPGDSPNFDFILPAGQYARLYYRGSYQQCGPSVTALQGWLKAHGLPCRGDVLELYHIDNRYTAHEEEFFTELQMPVE